MIKEVGKHQGMTLTRHFVTFLAPGSLMQEESTMPIETWDTDAAQDMAAKIVERHGARPFCFYFTTRGRQKDDLDSKVIKKSGRYFINCQLRTLEEVQADPENRILAANMENAGWQHVAITRNGWGWTQPFRQEDVILPD